jgi:uncharacterized lipoprotein NlpE involved in copper resistance
VNKTNKMLVMLMLTIVLTLAFGCSNHSQTAETAISPKANDNVVATSKATLAPTATPAPTTAPTATPKPTAIPKEEFLGAWKSCGLTTEDGKYYTVKQLEDIGNYNITDFYTIFNEKDAEVYIQGDIYQNVSWHTTVEGVVVGTNEMTLEKGKLSWRFDNEVLWYERVSGIKTVNDIKKNPNVGATLGQKNALDSAKSYLRLGGFSYEGLIKQLEYEQYTHEEAVFAADNCDANWKEQALMSAKSYIRMGGFSYKGLIKQLEYEQFTNEEATYAVDNCGADWNEQAVLSAQSYLKYSSFSKNGLISQLEYEGFTHEQAVYAVEQVGY